mgnify:CR=1 FL=1
MKILAALFVLLSLNLSAAELSIERLFDAPSLSGPTPQSLKISPDGKLVTFLRGKQTNQFQLDLWTRNIASGQEALLVDSATLVSGDGELSDEEKARRERLRIGQLSGIVAYDFSSDGRRLRLFRPFGRQAAIRPMLSSFRSTCCAQPSMAGSPSGCCGVRRSSSRTAWATRGSTRFAARRRRRYAT